LLLQEEEAPGPAAGKESGPELTEALTPRPQRKSPPQKAKPRVPEHLPVVEEVLEPAAVKAAPEEWRRIGEEITELLDYEPGRFLRRRTVRPKYVRRGDLDAVPIIAPLPDRILAGGIAAPGLLAQIVVGKFCDHLPLYRQEYIYQSRFGVELPRQTMARWMGEVAHWLQPIYQAIREQVMSGSYVQIDETPIRYLEPGHGQTKLGYLWTCCRPGHDVIYHWHTSRAAQCVEKIVPVAFNGFVQCAAISRTPPLRAVAASKAASWFWPAAWPMSGGSFLKRAPSRRKSRAGSFTNSPCSTRSKTNCGKRAPARRCGRRCAPPRAR
jgi:transposase